MRAESFKLIDLMADGDARFIPLYSFTVTGNCACNKQDCSAPGKHPRIKNWTFGGNRRREISPTGNTGFATGGGNYGCDTTTKLYAHVKPGGKWLNWTDDAGIIVSTDSILLITVLSSKTYHANFVQVVTGVINHSNTLDFRIFPNPASSVLQIECGSIGTYQAEIFNMVGDLVWSEKITQRLTVDVINFAKGCYIVKIDDGEGSITSKQFIVQ